MLYKPEQKKRPTRACFSCKNNNMKECFRTQSIKLQIPLRKLVELRSQYFKIIYKILKGNFKNEITISAKYFILLNVNIFICL